MQLVLDDIVAMKQDISVNTEHCVSEKALNIV